MILPPGLLDHPIAHRGLWRPGGAPENSLAAFEAAAQAGYGVELDVQLSADGAVVVFHDDRLERMTGAAGALSARSMADLAALRLNAGDQAIPTLAQALGAAGKHALVLVELKAGQTVGPLEDRVLQVIGGHAGPLALIGFSAASHAYLAKTASGLCRGLNCALPLDRLDADIALAQPHFLLPSLEAATSETVQVLRIQGLPAVGWTTRSADEWRSALPFCDNQIFEGFAP